MSMQQIPAQQPQQQMPVTPENIPPEVREFMELVGELMVASQNLLLYLLRIPDEAYNRYPVLRELRESAAELAEVIQKMSRLAKKRAEKMKGS